MSLNMNNATEVWEADWVIVDYPSNDTDTWEVVYSERYYPALDIKWYTPALATKTVKLVEKTGTKPTT